MSRRPIYLDNNATTHLDPTVIEAMIPFMRERFYNPSSPYRAGALQRAAVERARAGIAEAYGSNPSEIVFCSGGTEADNLALQGTFRSTDNSHRHLVLSAVEHPAVKETASALAAQNIALTEIPVSSEGKVELDALRAYLSRDTKLISVMHANNETGVLQPVEEIAEIAGSRGILFHMDAVQSAGRVPLNFAKSGASLISVSGHKIHGPKGIGFLYVRKGTPLSALLNGGGQESGLRCGTENVPAVIGLAEAVRISTERLQQDSQQMEKLRDRFETAVVHSLPNIKVLGKGAPRLPNTSALVLHGIDGESAVLEMDVRGVEISTGSACASGDETPSHVLLAMGLSNREAQSAVRISLSRYTTAEEVDFAASALIETVQRLRALSTL